MSAPTGITKDFVAKDNPSLAVLASGGLTRAEAPESTLHNQRFVPGKESGARSKSTKAPRIALSNGAENRPASVQLRRSILAVIAAKKRNGKDGAERS
jgi:hypothetical protein